MSRWLARSLAVTTVFLGPLISLTVVGQPANAVTAHSSSSSARGAASASFAEGLDIPEGDVSVYLDGLAPFGSTGTVARLSVVCGFVQGGLFYQQNVGTIAGSCTGAVLTGNTLQGQTVAGTCDVVVGVIQSVGGESISLNCAGLLGAKKPIKFGATATLPVNVDTSCPTPNSGGGPAFCEFDAFGVYQGA